MPSTFPYLTKTASISEFLKIIQTAGKPDNVNIGYLNSVGLTSSNDRPLVPLFRFLGFLDANGKPTEVYEQYRDKGRAKTVLGRAIRKAYSGLFATYPDANKRDEEALGNYFRSQTSLGDRAISAVVNTFKTLAGEAAFEEHDGETEETPTAPSKRGTKVSRIEAGEPMIPSVSITIQLQLPVTEKEDVYDKLFASLRKNLLDRSGEK